MKIIIIGATGTIGEAVVNALDKGHEIVRASRKGDVQVDLSKPDSIKAMYQSVKDVDAVISAAGEASFGSIDSLTDEDINLGVNRRSILTHYRRPKLTHL